MGEREIFAPGRVREPNKRKVEPDESGAGPVRDREGRQQRSGVLGGGSSSLPPSPPSVVGESGARPLALPRPFNVVVHCRNRMGFTLVRFEGGRLPPLGWGPDGDQAWAAVEMLGRCWESVPAEAALGAWQCQGLCSQRALEGDGGSSRRSTVTVRGQGGTEGSGGPEACRTRAALAGDVLRSDIAGHQMLGANSDD